MSTAPPLELSPLTEVLARQVCTWRYPEPWHIYDMGPWELVIAEGYGLGDPARRQREFLGALDLDGELVAYLRLSHHHERWMLGLGVHPARCDRGLGRACVELAWAEHASRHPGTPLWLEVRSWNTRAVRCYGAAGFEPAGAVSRTTPLGPGEFVVMRWDPARRS
jgi:[ribosomal protein S18]-alanine N-acetyltransferase